jgi:hypothetical protein
MMNGYHANLSKNSQKGAGMSLQRGDTDLAGFVMAENDAANEQVRSKRQIAEKESISLKSEN